MAGEIDPITVEVVNGYLLSVVQHMGVVLMKSSISPNITERRDCSMALLDPTGRTLVQHEVAPIHIGAVLGIGNILLARYPAETIRPGDAFIANDPYGGGGTHLPDVTLINPIFYQGQLLGFAANVAHHLDIGGRPGAAGGAQATIFEEGLRIPVIRIANEGRIVEEIVDLIALNSRLPEQRRADLRAQMAANDIAGARMAELCDRYGLDTYRAVSAELLRYARRKLEVGIRRIPDGRYVFTDYLDDDGAGQEHIPIRVAIEISGEKIHLDFTGTAPQVPGAINLVWNGLMAAVGYATRSIVDPTIPPNSGFLDAIKVTAPAGSLVNAQPPAAVGARADTAQRVAGVLFGAFAQALPERLMAGSNDATTVIALGGPDGRGGGYYAYVEAIGGGLGARPYKDGLDGIHTHMINVLNIPAEVLETEYPLRIERQMLRPDSGGPGRFRGGLGVEHAVRLLGTSATLAAHGDRQAIPAWGLVGGLNGACGCLLHAAGSGAARRIPAKIAGFALGHGDTVTVHSPGAGGWGDPLERAPALVLDDVRDGKVSVEAAFVHYGVVIGDDLTVDEAATAARRARAARERQALPVGCDGRPQILHTSPPRRLVRLSPALAIGLGLQAGFLVELQGHNPVPLRAWLEMDDAAGDQVLVDAEGCQVLGLAPGDAVRLRLLSGTAAPVPSSG